jgi:hypothetical protein
MIKEMILPDLVLPFVILVASLFFVFRHLRRDGAAPDKVIQFFLLWCVL